MSIRSLWSREFLAKRYVLWVLLISNFLGTIYGYYWYGSQLMYTAAHYEWWLLPFVPDSPTASLFFSITLVMLLFPPKRLSVIIWFRPLIEALAVITSIKYGIWACAMIFAGAAQGSEMVWQDWMLITSHTAMAVEALLYVRLFRISGAAAAAAVAWTLLNDTVDYTFGVFPWLPSVLNDDLAAVELFTFTLTLFSGLLAWLAVRAASKTEKLVKRI